MLKVLHITNNDYDGAGLAVTRIHAALLNIGVKSCVLVATKKNQNLDVFQIGYSKNKFSFILDLITLRPLLSRIQLQNIIFFIKSKIIEKIIRKIYKPKSLFNFNYQNSLYKYIKHYIKDYDVIVLYGVQGMLLSQDISKIYNDFNKKIIFRPLDMEPLTGGCHFNYDCLGWKESCENCPQIGTRSMNDISSKILKEKINNYKDIPIHWMACNSFVSDRIKSSQIVSSKHQFSMVFLGVHSDRYRFISTFDARKIHNLPQNKKIILFGCSDFTDIRKGAALLKELLKTNFSKEESLDLCVVTFGEANGFTFDNMDIEWIHLGSLSSDHQMNAVYRSADLFVNPSLDDLGPVIMIEAFVNKLPIVSFDVGIAKDIIINGVNGSIAKNFDVGNFSFLMKHNLDSLNKNFTDNVKIKKLYGQFMIESEASLFLKSIDYVG
ncbi:glycosyltransferase [Candidatus Thioglobus sp.]|nr:glycosyltransferase [Candidatus Thioglobus sp.]